MVFGGRILGGALLWKLPYDYFQFLDRKVAFPKKLVPLSWESLYNRI